MGQENERVCISSIMMRNAPEMHKTIQSVLAQTYQNFRFCVIVSEQTRPVLATYAEQDHRIELYDAIPGQLYRDFCYRQRDIFRAGNDGYYTSIDGDDWYDERYLESLLDCMKRTEADIVASGITYVDEKGITLGQLVTREMSWKVEDTANLLPWTYIYFRPVWGKLVKSEVFMKHDLEEIPHDAKEYGEYGGDTLFMMSLLTGAKKLAICENPFYFYRQLSSGMSHQMQENRLESDEFLFHFVVRQLKKIGKVGEPHIRFLFNVYGEALKDTITLIMQQPNSIQEKADQIMYVLRKDTTKELFDRERNDGLRFLDDWKEPQFVRSVYHLVFGGIDLSLLTEEEEEKCTQIFFQLYEVYEKVFSKDEMCILMREKEALDALIDKEYDTLFDVLLRTLTKVEDSRNQVVLGLLRRCSKKEWMRAFLKEKEFVVRYRELFLELQRSESNKVFERLLQLLSAETTPACFEQLIELWSVLAAQLENADEFIKSKQMGAYRYNMLGDTQRAEGYIRELKEMGVEFNGD